MDKLIEEIERTLETAERHDLNISSDSAMKWLPALIEQNKQMAGLIAEADSTLSLLDARGYIKYEKQGCPDAAEISQLIGRLRQKGTE